MPTLRPTIETAKAVLSVLGAAEWNVNCLQGMNYIFEVFDHSNAQTFLIGPASMDLTQLWYFTYVTTTQRAASASVKINRGTDATDFQALALIGQGSSFALYRRPNNQNLFLGEDNGSTLTDLVQFGTTGSFSVLIGPTVLSGAVIVNGNVTITGGNALSIAGSAGKAWDSGVINIAANSEPITGTVTFATNFNGRVPGVLLTSTFGAVPSVTAVTATTFSWTASGTNLAITGYWFAIG